MDWRSLVIFAVVIFALIWLIMRLRGNVRNPPKLQMSMDMIAALNDDLKLIRTKQEDAANIKKFKTANWKLYQLHLEYLEKEYIEALKISFDKMSEYNKKLLDMKVNALTEKPQIDLEELKTSIVKGRAGLAKWLQENVHRESTRGMFSWRN
jgi:hypothetical protein